MLLTEIRELEQMVESMRTKIRALLDHIPAGALPAPTVFGDPRSVPGGDSDGAAASAGGGLPSVARSVSVHGIVPSLGPAPTGVYAYDDTIPAVTRDGMVVLCASPNCNSGLTIEYAGPGRARWVPSGVKNPEDDE